MGLSKPDDEVCRDCRRLELEAARAARLPSVEARLAAAGVPWRYRRGWTVARWKAEFGEWPAAELAAWRPRSDRSVLLVSGEAPGVGKTGMGVLLLTQALAEGASGRWVRAQDLLDALRAEFSADRAGHASAHRLAYEALELERACREVDLLVLDDLFAGDRATPYARERFQLVLAVRYDEGIPTVVTTNRTAPELGTILPSLASRLLSGVHLHLSGRDRRAM